LKIRSFKIIIQLLWQCECNNHGEFNPREVVEESTKASMEITTLLSDKIARYLDLNTRQIQLTSANMANVDTPGYRAVGMDFEAEMRRAMTDIDAGEGLEEPRVTLVDGLVVRPDGNNVSMDRESLTLAEAQLRFKVGVALIKGQYSGIMNAIHADAK
jgi:flagellar basal-body rod protein FlgB